METKELYYPQISAQAGSYTFEEGVELEIYSSKSSYYDWAKIRFTSQFRPKLSLKKKDPATIQLGYDGNAGRTCSQASSPATTTAGRMPTRSR